MQTLTNLLNDTLTCLFSQNAYSDPIVVEATIDSSKSKYRDYLDELPGELFMATTSVLTMHAILQLGSTCKRLGAKMHASFPNLFKALSEIKATRTAPVPVLFFPAILSCIEQVSINRVPATLLRKLLVDVPRNRRSLDSRIPATQRVYVNHIETAVARQKHLIPFPPACRADALYSIDLMVARHLCGAVNAESTRKELSFLLLHTTHAFWPAMLDSVLVDIPADDIPEAIKIFLDRYEGSVEKISNSFAKALASEMFFQRDLLDAFRDSKNKGAIIREILQTRFGVTRDVQWQVIDECIALNLHKNLNSLPGARFDKLCENWRANDTNFVILAEQMTVAKAPHFNFGDRSMRSNSWIN
ncbi:hypothetical protein WM40_19730 [Robbsia andropogonis]|uniref:Uncharacterized protein n=1 Tax=Robbsia andropogonis TaxID=28092 RepID=A0A0F5JWC2_9BURK|nr:hypothetical protein [Robbsia andropogonis]KKB62010.1 hypothetical protein WM40_19730 [Robbsia andropogonis]